MLAPTFGLSSIPNQIGDYDIDSKKICSTKAILCTTKDAIWNKIAIKCIESGSSPNEAYIHTDVTENTPSPFIIPLQFFAQQPNFDAFFMPLALNEDLFYYISYNQPDDPTIWRKIMKQCALAVEALHTRERPIAHLDIKPENFLIMNEDLHNPRIQLADFGSAEYYNPNQPFMKPYGTSAYQAPEVYYNQPYGLEADIWSLGMTFYMLICSNHPFLSEDGHCRIDYNPENFFQEYQWGEYEELAEFVKWILCLDPNERPTITEIVQHEIIRDVELVFDDDKNTVAINETAIFLHNTDDEVDVAPISIEDDNPFNTM